jgi:hypothetical protein
MTATNDTVNFSTLFKLCVREQHPVLFWSDWLRADIDHSKHFESAPSSSLCLLALGWPRFRTCSSQNYSLKEKLCMGPPIGKSSVLVVDDFNLPHPDTYMLHPPIELLRSIINMTGLSNQQAHVLDKGSQHGSRHSRLALRERHLRLWHVLRWGAVYTSCAVIPTVNFMHPVADYHYPNELRRVLRRSGQQCCISLHGD